MWTSGVCPLQGSVSYRRRWSPLHARQHVGCWDEYCEGYQQAMASSRLRPVCPLPTCSFVSERLSGEPESRAGPWSLELTSEPQRER